MYISTKPVAEANKMRISTKAFGLVLLFSLAGCSPTLPDCNEEFALTSLKNFYHEEVGTSNDIVEISFSMFKTDGIDSNGRKNCNCAVTVRYKPSVSQSITKLVASRSSDIELQVVKNLDGFNEKKSMINYQLYKTDDGSTAISTNKLWILATNLSYKVVRGKLPAVTSETANATPPEGKYFQIALLDGNTVNDLIMGRPSSPAAKTLFREKVLNRLPENAALKTAFSHWGTQSAFSRATQRTLVGMACKPHDCGDNHMYIAVSEDYSLAVILKREGRCTVYKTESYSDWTALEKNHALCPTYESENRLN
jgi:hypothetical protein